MAMTLHGICRDKVDDTRQIQGKIRHNRNKRKKEAWLGLVWTDGMLLMLMLMLMFERLESSQGWLLSSL